MLDLTQYVPNLALVLILYCVAEILKVTFMKTDNRRSLLPVICGLLGACGAVAIFVLYPGLMNCANVLDAVICGIISGFAATGANQVYKQIKKDTTSITIDE